MQFRIGERLIGDHAPVFIVAEMSANHQQDFDVAVKIIKAAKKNWGGCHQNANVHSG